MAFGLRCIPWHSFLNRFTEVPLCPEWMPRAALESSTQAESWLLRPAPLVCGEGKGHSEQCGRKKAARPQEEQNELLRMILAAHPA
jgi:hypothetical protein